MDEPHITDPVERVVADALTKAGLFFIHDSQVPGPALDFYVPGLGIHIECKRFHTERVNEQMARHVNVILVQGLSAADAFAFLIAEHNARGGGR